MNRKLNDQVIYKKKQIPEELRWDVFERDDFTCQYCGSRRMLAVDHIVPESRGGSIEKSNLITSCNICNSHKGSRTPEEACMELQSDPRNR
ncbi:HNH endonuclease [Paenibacillus tarimensis]